MPIEVSCPACGVKLKAPESKAGKKAKCGKCGARVRIPGPVPHVDSVGETHMLMPAPAPGLPGDDEPVPMASAVDDLDPLPVAPPLTSAISTPSNPGRPAFGSATSELKPKSKPKAPSISPPPAPSPPTPEMLSLDDEPAPTPPAAPGGPFAFIAPHAPLPKGGSKSKLKAIEEEKPRPNENPKDEPVEEHRGYVRPGERKGGNTLLLAGIIGVIAIAASIVAVVVYLNKSKPPEQAKTAEKKDETPEPPKDDKNGKKEQKTEPAKKDGSIPKGDAKQQAGDPPLPMLALPPMARTMQFRVLAAKPEFTQGPSNAPIQVDAPFDKVKRFFLTENRVAQDVVVVWQASAEAGGKGERFAVDLYSGTTGKRVERFEYDGDEAEPKCDVATDGKHFTAITADGKITVWNLAEKTKALEGFDPYSEKPEHKKAGLAGLFFARNPNNLITVTTAGAVHLFELATRKQIGEFVPPKGSAGRIAMGKNVAADDGRASVVLVASGAVYQISTLAPLSVAWKLELGGDLGRTLGIATVGVPGRVAIAFETDVPKKKEQGLLFCLPNNKPLLFRWPDRAGEPAAIHWAGMNMAVISTARRTVGRRGGEDVFARGAGRDARREGAARRNRVVALVSDSQSS